MDYLVYVGRDVKTWLHFNMYSKARHSPFWSFIRLIIYNIKYCIAQHRSGNLQTYRVIRSLITLQIQEKKYAQDDHSAQKLHFVVIHLEVLSYIPAKKAVQWHSQIIVRAKWSPCMHTLMGTLALKYDVNCQL